MRTFLQSIEQWSVLYVRHIFSWKLFTHTLTKTKFSLWSQVIDERINFILLKQFLRSIRQVFFFVPKIQTKHLYRVLFTKKNKQITRSYTFISFQLNIVTQERSYFW